MTLLTTFAVLALAAASPARTSSPTSNTGTPPTPREDSPAARHTPGPHGIPLVVHAQMGGKEAEGVVAYLEALG